jgi:MerR family transcriptional regulator, thiopeptide resistance regulator
VIGEDGLRRRWSIGELARATGVTVRALHHYDDIGLVVAGERTSMGHRRYTEADLRRLYRVRALRYLGLSLDEVAATLKGPDDDLLALRDLLANQLSQLDLHAKRVDRLRMQISYLLAQLNDDQDMPDPGQFMMTLEMISVAQTYLTQEQVDRFSAHGTELGEDGVRAVNLDFAAMVDEAIRQQRAGTPENDPAVRALAARWNAVSAQAGFVKPEDKMSNQKIWEDYREQIGELVPWPAADFTSAVEYLARIGDKHS